MFTITCPLLLPRERAHFGLYVEGTGLATNGCGSGGFARHDKQVFTAPHSETPCIGLDICTFHSSNIVIRIDYLTTTIKRIKRIDFSTTDFTDSSTSEAA